MAGRALPGWVTLLAVLLIASAAPGFAWSGQLVGAMMDNKPSGRLTLDGAWTETTTTSTMSISGSKGTWTSGHATRPGFTVTRIQGNVYRFVFPDDKAYLAWLFSENLIVFDNYTWWTKWAA